MEFQMLQYIQRISHFEFPIKHNRAHFQNFWSGGVFIVT